MSLATAWVIDSFGVKRSGFLADWNYNDVLVDNDGNVYTQGKPGEKPINLDSLFDYAKENRVYGEGDIITKFCNLETFTEWTIYASDTRPFAYSNSALNAPQCGYQTPLPEPAVPYNPFGTPTYNPYRTFQCCDIEYQPIEVVIEKKEYQGDNIFIEYGADSPVTITLDELEVKDAPIRVTGAVLGFVNTVDFQRDEFYTEDERTFRISIYKNGLLKFRGYMAPDNSSEPFDSAPYPVSIKVTDGLGSLKSVTYPLPIGQTFDLKQNFVEIIAYCLAPLNLNLDISTICNLYSEGMLNGLGDDPLQQAYVNPLRLVDSKGSTLTCYDVLTEVCKAWKASLQMHEGRWLIYRSNELAFPDSRMRTYNYKGLKLRSELFNTKRVVGGPI